MPLLIVVSLIWGFSPGLIKTQLVGVDGSVVTAVRLGLAFLVFLPWLRLRGISGRTATTLVTIGAVQFGLMYLAYNEAFRFLRAYEVVLFTITTPILVTLLADALDRKLRIRALAAACLAVLGAALVIVRSNALQLTLVGLALVQASNLAFAAGQIAYQRLRARQTDLQDRSIFALLYGGAFAVGVIAMFARGPSVTLNASQLVTLVYLGVIASGIGFFLWNVGATRVRAATLAVMNNLKIPLGIACSLIFFREQASVPWLLASFTVMGAAVWLAEKR